MEAKYRAIASKFRVSPNLVRLIAEELDGPAIEIVERRGSWYVLSDGSRVQGKKNLPAHLQ